MMRSVLVLSISVAGCASSAAVEVSVAPPTTTAPQELPPTNAARAEPATDGVWARSFPRAREFAEVDVRAPTTLLLTWRVGPHHQLEKRGIPEDDFAENFGSTVDLVVDGTVVSFGGIPGKIVAPELPYCARLGWHKPDGPVGFPPYVVSSLTLDIPQRVDDFMIVRDGATLHVLHRSTSEETTCNKTMEGPLDICAGEPWSIRADLHIAGHPALYERVEQAGAPCDCGAPLGEGTRLLSPRDVTTH